MAYDGPSVSLEPFENDRRVRPLSMPLSSFRRPNDGMCGILGFVTTDDVLSQAPQHFRFPMAKATCERPPTCGGYFACRSVSSEADSSEDR